MYWVPVQEIAGIPKIANRKSEFQFSSSPGIGISKKILTGIFGIVNGIGSPPPMGVPEIGTKNRNSQPWFADRSMLSGHEWWPQPHIQPWNHGNAASIHAWPGSAAIQNQPAALNVVAHGPECNWACVGLCQVCFGGISLVTCQNEGCARQLHHMWQFGRVLMRGGRHAAAKSYVHFTIQLWITFLHLTQLKFASLQFLLLAKSRQLMSLTPIVPSFMAKKSHWLMILTPMMAKLNGFLIQNKVFGRCTNKR